MRKLLSIAVLLFYQNDVAIIFTFNLYLAIAAAENSPKQLIGHPNNWLLYFITITFLTYFNSNQWLKSWFFISRNNSIGDQWKFHYGIGKVAAQRLWVKAGCHCKLHLTHHVFNDAIYRDNSLRKLSSKPLSSN